MPIDVLCWVWFPQVKESLQELYLGSSVVPSKQKFPADLLLHLFPQVTVEKVIL